MIVIEIGGTSYKLHTIKEPHYQEVVWLIFFLFFYWFLKKNHRYINIEFASFFKIEFDRIKLRKAVSEN